MPGAELVVSASKGGPKRPEKGAKRPQSKVTSQARQGVTRFLDGGDKRGPVARRFRDLISEITSDLGGPEALSETQRQIIKRIASLSVWCESAEAKMADGEEVDVDRLGRTANSNAPFRIPKALYENIKVVTCITRHAGWAVIAANLRRSINWKPRRS